MDAMGRKPLQHRIRHLKVPQVTFLYGDNDWMDSSGGLAAERTCQQVRTAPKVDVLEVPKAGHLLMLDNWAAVNAGIIVGGLGINHQQAPQVLSKEEATAVPRKLAVGAPNVSTPPSAPAARNPTTARSSVDGELKQTSVSIQA